MQRLSHPQLVAMDEILVAASLGLAIGIGFRWFDLPLPAPPTFGGSMLVLAVTLGYMWATHYLGGVS